MGSAVEAQGRRRVRREAWPPELAPTIAHGGGARLERSAAARPGKSVATAAEGYATGAKPSVAEVNMIGAELGLRARSTWSGRSQTATTG